MSARDTASSANVATLPWMTSLQDTASNLEAAPPASVSVPMPMPVPVLPPVASAPVQPMFATRVPPPAPIVLQAGTLRNVNIPLSSSPPTPAPTLSKLDVVLASAVFRHVIALVCVFILSFIILIVVQPPFTHTKSKDKYKRGKFSTGIAALYALGATVLAAVAMTITHFVMNANTKLA